jgi:hypothetical protein
MTTGDDDVLLRALRELPPLGGRIDAAALKRQRTSARAAFVRAFDDEPWHTRAFGSVGRAAVPVVLASVVGLYLFWAVAAASALFR